MNEARIKIIDSFRGIAATFVVLFHLFEKVNIQIFNFGVTGVDLFFIISGFVIFFTLNKTSDWKVFLVKRFARLYPIYWVVITITALLIFITKSMGLNEILYRYTFNFTMFQHYFKVPHLDFQYWTLTVEIQFYILILLIFVWKLHNKIESISILLLSICLIYNFVLETELYNLYNFIHNAFPLINHLPLFISGIVFYRIWALNFNIQRFSIIVACYLCQLFLFDNGGQSNGFINFNIYIYTTSFYFLLFMLLFMKKIKLFENKLLFFLGDISYSLYLFHQFFSITILIPFLMKYISNEYLCIIIGFSTNIFIASFLTYYAEKPLTKFFKTRLLNLFFVNK